MSIRRLVFLAVLAISGPAFAETPASTSPSATAKARPRRQAEKLDHERSLALKSKRKVHELDTVHVFGRPQRPLASIETATPRFRFPVGTARYSERDRRFLKSQRDERW